jgi:hypothetical protein
MSKNVHLLTNVAEDLDRMRSDAVAEGHPMLALLLQLAHDEAKEELDRQEPKKTRKARRPELPSNIIPFPALRLRNRVRARA